MERTIAGVDQLLEYILKNDKEAASIQQARISKHLGGFNKLIILMFLELICDQVQKIFTPSVAFAECVSAYLVTSKYDEAKILAKLYVISPRSFIDPVKRLGEKVKINLLKRRKIIRCVFRETFKALNDLQDSSTTSIMMRFVRVLLVNANVIFQHRTIWKQTNPKMKRN